MVEKTIVQLKEEVEESFYHYGYEEDMKAIIAKLDRCELLEKENEFLKHELKIVEQDLVRLAKEKADTFFGKTNYMGGSPCQQEGFENGQ